MGLKKRCVWYKIGRHSCDVANCEVNHDLVIMHKNTHTSIEKSYTQKFSNPNLKKKTNAFSNFRFDFVAINIAKLVLHTHYIKSLSRLSNLFSQDAMILKISLVQSLDIKLGELTKIIIIRCLRSVSRKPSYPPRGDALFWISAILTKGFAK